MNFIARRGTPSPTSPDPGLQFGASALTHVTFNNLECQPLVFASTNSTSPGNASVAVPAVAAVPLIDPRDIPKVVTGQILHWREFGQPQARGIQGAFVALGLKGILEM